MLFTWKFTLNVFYYFTFLLVNISSTPIHNLLTWINVVHLWDAVCIIANLPAITKSGHIWKLHKKVTTCYLKPPILSLQKHWLRISISWSFNSKWDKLIQIMYIEHGVKCVISVANLFKLKQMFWIICLLAYLILFHISPDHRTW